MGDGVLPYFFDEVGAVFHHGVLAQLQDFGFLFDAELEEVEHEKVVFLIAQVGISGFQPFEGVRIDRVEGVDDAFALVAF